jgi:hypothetical protein
VPTSHAAPSGDPRAVVAAWLSALEVVLRERDMASFTSLLGTDPWWRDMYALSWDNGRRSSHT